MESSEILLPLSVGSMTSNRSSSKLNDEASVPLTISSMIPNTITSMYRISLVTNGHKLDEPSIERNESTKSYVKNDVSRRLRQRKQLHSRLYVNIDYLL